MFRLGSNRIHALFSLFLRLVLTCCAGDAAALRLTIARVGHLKAASRKAAGKWFKLDRFGSRHHSNLW
jgi:hypothetical protein